MNDRISNELELIRQFYPDVRFHEDNNGWWFLIPDYQLPSGWDPPSTPIAFQVKPGYPGTPPYGFYTPKEIHFKGKVPNNYKESPNVAPPFEGNWGLFSWSKTGQWHPTSNLKTGSNLLNWILSFSDRFKEGQ